jgi:hypothetical protein
LILSEDMIMIELQDIFEQYGKSYTATHKLPSHHQKVIDCIESCRTSVLGGHVDECDNCDYTHISYNSCRNRHCPKCQTLSKERWIEDRKQDLLPVQYFHVVFTIPDIINPVALQNQKIVYTILFKAVSETLLELAGDKKYLGAQIGFTSILHTWGQNLMHHPHIHCIVPGGGLSECNKWVNSRDKFFIPVKVLSRKFKGKFLHNFKKAYEDGALKFYGSMENLTLEQDFRSMINTLYSREWVVYCKEPFKGPEHVVEYLGRYTHRVAISNNRIISAENGKVTFKWRDYKDKNTEKLMTLSATEFIRRFLLHVLPNRFVKIRHYGILGNRNRKTKLSLSKRLTGARLRISTAKKSVEEMMLKLTGRDITKCPRCDCGRLQRTKNFTKQGISPPINTKVTA